LRCITITELADKPRPKSLPWHPTSQSLLQAVANSVCGNDATAGRRFSTTIIQQDMNPNKVIKQKTPHIPMTSKKLKKMLILYT
jgi:hypothetical protein